METARWTDILMLLTIAVVIDRRVYKEEVDAFRREALALCEILTPDMIFSDKMAFDWFLVHRDRVMRWLIEPQSNQKIIGHLKKLSAEPERGRILQALYTISMSDNECHRSEAEFLALAAKHWKLPNPVALNRKIAS